MPPTSSHAGDDPYNRLSDFERIAMKTVGVSIVIAALMTVAAGVGVAARPSSKPSGAGPRYVPETIVPKDFGGWREVAQEGAQVVNPQTQELLNKLYSQILTRTYVNASGYRVMLSLAYGDDQRADLTAHKPEVCYPAQGFALLSNDSSNVATPFGDIAARRLNTRMGARHEPVTYWFTVADTAIRNKVEQRMIEIRSGLTGQVPDGLLVRVSSIDVSPQNAYKLQDQFVAGLLGSVPEADRRRLSGLGPAVISQ
jgi:EpsI family protein